MTEAQKDQRLAELREALLVISQTIVDHLKAGKEIAQMKEELNLQALVINELKNLALIAG